MLNNFTFELVFLSESNKTMARVCEQRGSAGGRARVPGDDGRCAWPLGMHTHNI